MYTTVLADCPECHKQRECKILECDDCPEDQCVHLECTICFEEFGD